jgi:DNA recombination protein RmuC
MTTLLIVIAVVLLVALAALATVYIRLNARAAALDKENVMLDAMNARQADEILKCNADLQNMQTLREEMYVRIASLESEKKSMAERVEAQKEQYKAALEHMRVEFKAIAIDALEKNSELFNKQSQERLDAVLRPFDNDLKQFREKVDSYYGEESRQRFSLQENIKGLIEANQRISRDAINLTNALVGTNNNKFQGDWGETILEQILENSGLVKGEQWEMQATLRDEMGCALQSEENNSLMKPDIIVHFPGKRDIIIDSKVSLKSYMAYLAAEDDTSRAFCLKEHVASVRKHIDELAGKRYDKYNVNSLDYVMLFIPNEPSYFVAMEADNKLWNYAYKKGVVLISPSNLISTLFVVNSLWTRERQQRDVQKIVDTANAIYDKFVNFADNFTKIESSLDKASEAYREAFKQLTTGKGNITKRLSELKEFGLLTTTKQIPEGLVEKQ